MSWEIELTHHWPLLDVYGAGIVYDAGSFLHLKVSDVIRDGNLEQVFEKPFYFMGFEGLGFQ